MTVPALRQHALSLFSQGVEAADPYQAVKQHLTINNHHIEFRLASKNGTKLRQGYWSKVHIIAFGKAACSMIKAAKETLKGHVEIVTAIAVTNTENAIPVAEVEVISAGHPTPNLAGLKAAQRIVKTLHNTRKGELVLALISGGGSALLPLPVQGISLEDKQKTTDLLLACGADITQINCVRKHLSQLKGGRLAELAAPADQHSLILSDVIGDDLSSIASGPTVADNSTFNQAINILTNKAIWDKIPSSVKSILTKGAAGEIKETTKPKAAFFKNTTHSLIGSNSISLNKCLQSAKNLGFATLVFNNALSGEARNIAEQLALYAKQVENRPYKATAIIAGGETTVTLLGNGLGGRNQEMALAFALAAEKHNLTSHWVFLSGGTDGRDGPTDAAGGLVDSKSLSRMRQANLDPADFLNNNDSYTALKESKDLVITGATGTNVADLQILLIQPE